MSKQIWMFKDHKMENMEREVNMFMKSIPENEIYDVSSSTDHYDIVVTVVYHEP